MLLRTRLRAERLLAILCLAALPAAALVAPARPDPAGAGEEGEVLLQAMEEMQSQLRKLRALVGDAERKAAALESLRVMQAQALVAYENPPGPAAGSDELSSGSWRIGFRRQIVGLLDALLELELAVHEGRLEDAQEGYKNLSRLKQAGHDVYMLED